MSEAMASLVSGGVAQQAQQKSQLSSTQNALDEAASGADFPSVFHQLINDSADQTSADGSSNPADMAASAMLPLQPFTVNGVTALDSYMSLPSLINPDAQSLPLDGNALPLLSPQMSWSGSVAYANNNGAIAKSFLGNGDQVMQTGPVLDANINGSIARSQQQLQDLLALQPTSLGLNTDPALAEQTSDFMEQLLVAGKEGGAAHNSLLHQINAQPTNVSLSSMLSTLSVADTLDPALTGGRGATAIQVTPQHPQWGQQVGDRVHWMVGQGLQHADIRLNPPELGSLEIRIQLQGDQATVNFTSPHATVRDAIEAAMPRLREMLEQGGLSLADVNVSSQSAGQHGEHTGQAAGGGHGPQAAQAGEQEEMAISSQTRTQTGSGMLDVYA